MSAQPWPRIKGLEPEGLGFCRIDHFVNIDAHAQAQLLQLVDESNVDAAINILKELAHLRDRRAADRHYAAEDRAVHGCGQLRADRTATTHHFRNISPIRAVVAGIFALRRKHRMHASGSVAAGHFQPVGVAAFE